MKHINHLIDIVGQSHQHTPALLSLLIGLFSIRRDPFLFIDEDATGDNIPMTLVDSLNKR